MDDEMLVTLKVLSDASRLRIVGLLAARPYAVVELAAAVELSAGTVVHHLKRLQAAGLVESRPTPPYVEYSLRAERLRAVGRRLGEIERAREDIAVVPAPDGQPLPAFDAKVLRSFFEGDRLVSIPAQEKKKLVVLRHLLGRCFPEYRPYAEKEVNRRLAVYHPDVASLRRHLVEHGLMTREAGVYRRAPHSSMWRRPQPG
jgi:DNA-binding transcriptional ArsR family regulator